MDEEDGHSARLTQLRIRSTRCALNAYPGM
jgi:hypothetical protein